MTLKDPDTRPPASCRTLQNPPTTSLKGIASTFLLPVQVASTFLLPVLSSEFLLRKFHFGKHGADHINPVFSLIASLKGPYLSILDQVAMPSSGDEGLGWRTSPFPCSRMSAFYPPTLCKGSESPQRPLRMPSDRCSGPTGLRNANHAVGGGSAPWTEPHKAPTAMPRDRCPGPKGWRKVNHAVGGSSAPRTEPISAAEGGLGQRTGARVKGNWCCGYYFLPLRLWPSHLLSLGPTFYSKMGCGDGFQGPLPEPWYPCHLDQETSDSSLTCMASAGGTWLVDGRVTRPKVLESGCGLQSR